MKELTIEKFKELATVHKPHCISIFISTHRAGQEVNEKIDQINLKNQIRKVTKELESWQLDSRDIEDLLRPIKAMVEDTGFWNNQSDGLAIFRSPDTMEYYTLPVPFVEMVYVSDHFYVKPLVSYINDESKFYVLALSLSGATFYEGYAHQINKVEIEDLLPGQLEDTVGYDYKEKSLQMRSGQTGFDRNMYHGHGKGNEEAKMEIEKFFRAINDGLMKILNGHKRPLVIAAVDYLVPIYRSVNDYQHLFEGFIPGNPEHEDPILLHEKAKHLLEGFFGKERKKKLSNFEQALSQKRASWKEEEIIPAAVSKQVDTLFVKNGEMMFGVYDPESNTIKPRDEKTRYKSCLLNFAVVHTILNNGNVYLLEPEELPEPNSKLNAVFRF